MGDRQARRIDFAHHTLQIGRLQRYATDVAMAQGKQFYPRPASTGKRVAAPERHAVMVQGDGDRDPEQALVEPVGEWPREDAPDLAAQHRRSTGHEVIQRKLES